MMSKFGTKSPDFAQRDNINDKMTDDEFDK